MPDTPATEANPPPKSRDLAAVTALLAAGVLVVPPVMSGFGPASL